MDNPVQVVINNPFRYLCDTAPGCLCSYKSIGNIPKYKILHSGGGAVLDILSEDLKEEKQTLTSRREPMRCVLMWTGKMPFPCWPTTQR